MNPIAQLEQDIERLQRLADALDALSPCPTSRLLLVTWLAERINGSAQLAEAVHQLPTLPQGLVDDYRTWISKNSL